LYTVGRAARTGVATVTYKNTACGVAITVVDAVAIRIPPQSTFLTYKGIALGVVVAAGKKILNKAHVRAP
jgi:hypothetical protein